jgi:tetratricopeptide (TPR) repeat protein
VCRRAAHTVHLSNALRNLSITARNKGDIDLEWTALEELEPLARRLGQTLVICEVWRAKGSIERARGQYVAAVGFFKVWEEFATEHRVELPTLDAGMARANQAELHFRIHPELRQQAHAERMTTQCANADDSVDVEDHRLRAALPDDATSSEHDGILALACVVARRLAKQGEFDRAEALLARHERSIRRSRRYQDYWLLRIGLLRATGRWTDAAEVLEGSIAELMEVDAKAAYWLVLERARLLNESGQRDAALVEFDRYLEAPKGVREARGIEAAPYEKGQVLQDLWRLRPAIAEYEKVIGRGDKLGPSEWYAQACGACFNVLTMLGRQADEERRIGCWERLARRASGRRYIAR